MSKIRTLLISAGVATAAFAAPAIAFASGVFHPAGGESGVTEHPSHRMLSKDRADVVAERNAALRSQKQVVPTGEAIEYPMPTPQVGSGLTRAEVERETLRAMKAGEIRSGESV